MEIFAEPPYFSETAEIEARPMPVPPCLVEQYSSLPFLTLPSKLLVDTKPGRHLAVVAEQGIERGIGTVICRRVFCETGFVLRKVRQDAVGVSLFCKGSEQSDGMAKVVAQSCGLAYMLLQGMILVRLHFKESRAVPKFCMLQYNEDAPVKKHIDGQRAGQLQVNRVPVRRMKNCSSADRNLQAFMVALPSRAAVWHRTPGGMRLTFAYFLEMIVPRHLLDSGAVAHADREFYAAFHDTAASLKFKDIFGIYGDSFVDGDEAGIAAGLPEDGAEPFHFA